jgi:hypothetical protein
MGHIIGIPRQERQYLCWDDLIGPDNPVRVLDVTNHEKCTTNLHQKCTTDKS